VPFELVKPGTHIDFVRFARPAAILSLVLILASIAAIPVRGFRLGIDFAGGTEVQVRFTDERAAGEGAIRDVVGRFVGEASVVRFGEPGSQEYLIKFPEGQGDRGERVDRIAEALESEVGPLVVDRVEFVGPKVGEELRADGLQALGVAGLLVLLYIGFRFTARFAPGAIMAVIHDVLLTGGLFVVLGMEFDLRVLAAMLAIVGYSLNDTIIVYDRIRENMEIRTRQDLPEVINQSINQTLGRTLLTSGTTLLAVLALLFLGGEVIEPFAFAMTVGIVVGTYSTIYVAAPTLLFLERRFGSGAGGTGTRAKSPRAGPGKKARPPRAARA